MQHPDSEAQTSTARAPIWQTLAGLAQRLLTVLNATASGREADACSIAVDLSALADEVRAEITRAREEGRIEERQRVAALLRDQEALARGDAAWQRGQLDATLGKAAALAEARKRLDQPDCPDALAAEGRG